VRRKAVTGGGIERATNGDREEGSKWRRGSRRGQPRGVQRKGERGSEEEREVKQVFGGGEGRR